MDDRSLEADVRRLVDDYRVQCLWFLREGHHPESPQECERA